MKTIQPLSFIAGCLFVIAIWSLLGLTNDPDGTTSCGNLRPGHSCFHYFETTDTTTTADSAIFQWDQCPYISFKLDDPSGAASIFMMESSEKTIGGDETVFTCDLNNDGAVDAVDEATEIDGTAGKRGCKGIRPASRWGWIDVQAVPSSGDARVSIVCHSS